MVVAPDPKKGPVCPECGSEGLKTMKLFNKTLTACTGCGWRKAA